MIENTEKKKGKKIKKDRLLALLNSGKKEAKRKSKKKTAKKTKKKTVKKKPKKKEIQITPLDVELIKDQFESEEDALFYLTWLECGQNATEAYKKLHPKVSDHSARVLGSRAFGRIDKTIILEVVGLGLGKWMEQLREGLGAVKYVGLGAMEVPDHKVRRAYHQVQGELLGVEKSGQSQTNVNIFNQVANKLDQYFEEV